jgi:hypothetical protein
MDRGSTGKGFSTNNTAAIVSGGFQNHYKIERFGDFVPFKNVMLQ